MAPGWRSTPVRGARRAGATSSAEAGGAHLQDLLPVLCGAHAARARARVRRSGARRAGQHGDQRRRVLARGPRPERRTKHTRHWSLTRVQRWPLRPPLPHSSSAARYCGQALWPARAEGPSELRGAGAGVSEANGAWGPSRARPSPWEPAPNCGLPRGKARFREEAVT